MENILKSMINGNNKYQWEILQENEKIELDHTVPKYPFLILTCMNPQIDVHRIFQLNPGDAFVLRNAGNQYTEDVLRSILIAVLEYNVGYIIVLGHLDCGMKKIQLNKLRNKLSNPALKQIGQYGTNYDLALQRFFKPFADEITNINNQVDRLKMAKEIPSNIKVIGMLFDPLTGWVFQENEFKHYTSYRNFKQNYQKLLQQKRLNHIDFLETIENEIVGPELTVSDELFEKSEDIDTLGDKIGENGDINLKKELVSEVEFKELQQILEKNAEFIKKSMNIVSKIQIPMIRAPKIKVHIPKVNIYKKKD
jgi:carbonic anhydrase